MRYHEMLNKYKLCHSYLENRLYPFQNSWARYSIAKTFTAGVESTQRVESINGVIKKLMDQGTLLKELVIAIERELDKESYYTRINDYYRTNPSIRLPSTYNTIFKEIDLVLQAYLSPILLSIQRTQMNQALLYQETLILFEYIKEDDGNFEGVLEHSYDIPQIHLKEFLNNIPYNNIKKIWKVSYIASKSSKSHYIIILEDSTSLCTCMFIVNQGMLCHYQYRFNQVPSDLMGFITVVSTERKHSSVPLSYITYLRTDDVYTPAIREQVSKKVKYGNAMSMVKTSVQIAVKEDVISEFIGLLTENTLLQDPQRSFTENSREPLAELPEISNPEYHKTKGHPLKHLKSSIKESKNTSVGNI
ncbi:unnamed protein product [Rhizophagus irregularis]|nr:unnamed protein product [Rhizophagus irregularis]